VRKRVNDLVVGDAGVNQRLHDKWSNSEVRR
jgi:hypothetical protein